MLNNYLFVLSSIVLGLLSASEKCKNYLMEETHGTYNSSLLDITYNLTYENISCIPKIYAHILYKNINLSVNTNDTDIPTTPCNSTAAEILNFTAQVNTTLLFNFSADCKQKNEMQIYSLYYVAIYSRGDSYVFKCHTSNQLTTCIPNTNLKTNASSVESSARIRRFSNGEMCLFGPDENCDFRCNCFNNRTCDPSSAKCPYNRCSTRYYGQHDCQRRCPDGKYVKYRVSPICTETCKCQTWNKCIAQTGGCLDDKCQKGYSVQNVSGRCIPCYHGTFGMTCSKKCYCLKNESCDSVTGKCPSLCMAGYTGRSCSKPCRNRMYGLNCSRRCNCDKNAQCDRQIGSCPDRCKKGFTGLACNKRIPKPTTTSTTTTTTTKKPSPDCPTGRWGPRCTLYCNCKGHDKCNDDGICARGCLDGYNGTTCNKTIAKKITRPASNTSVVMGIIGGVIFCALIFASAYLGLKWHREASEANKRMAEEVEYKEETRKSKSGIHKKDPDYEYGEYADPTIAGDPYDMDSPKTRTDRRKKKKKKKSARAGADDDEKKSRSPSTASLRKIDSKTAATPSRLYEYFLKKQEDENEQREEQEREQEIENEKEQYKSKHRRRMKD